MTEREGITKFGLEYRWASPPEAALTRPLNAWELLHKLGLIGWDPARYGGLAFGNLSRRLENSQGNDLTVFLISRMQTGHLAQLEPEHYPRVRECDAKHNRTADGHCV